jgi:ribosome-associated toxin RatA of RatAB toxin-antitoxin module
MWFNIGANCPCVPVRHATITHVRQAASAANPWAGSAGMNRIERSALAPHSAASLYALVNDVAAYPSFLPWCEAATVHEQTPYRLRASIALRRGLVRARFTTCNQLTPDSSIRMQLEDGPFSRLEGEWRFEPLSDAACRVSLRLEFDFASALLAATLGPVFNGIADTLVDAFVQRARQLGTAGTRPPP